MPDGEVGAGDVRDEVLGLCEEVAEELPEGRERGGEGFCEGLAGEGGEEIASEPGGYDGDCGGAGDEGEHGDDDGSEDGDAGVRLGGCLGFGRSVVLDEGGVVDGPAGDELSEDSAGLGDEGTGQEDGIDDSRGDDPGVEADGSPGGKDDDEEPEGHGGVEHMESTELPGVSKNRGRGPRQRYRHAGSI